MISTNDIKNGMTIIFNGQVHQVVEFQHVKPGKGHAFVRTRLKNLRTGQVLENIFKAKDEVEQAIIERHIAQFLYRTPENLVFMDTNTYEQFEVPVSKWQQLLPYLKENEEVTTVVYETDVIDIVLPFTVVLKVVQAMPGVRGDTATGANKPVQVETGATIQVPLFINEGDVIKVDTRTGEYLTRA
ncbi:MAG TPA: elongation factor P [Planctomycetota bacterium]|nr:elongation factor P [Planctomycetota bacterium]